MTDDLISRQAVLEKKLYTETEEGWSGYTVDVKDIESLPSIQPRQRTGHWIENNFGHILCSECGGMRKDNRIHHIAYCNKCGAKMQ